MRIIAAFFLLFLAFVSFSNAQTDTGRVGGTVLDPTGAVVPNATITVKNQANGRVFNTTSDPSSGAFNVPGVPVGRYQIKVEAVGFQTYQQNLQVDPGQVANATVNLQTGAQTEVVNVTEQAALVESATSDVGATIQGRQVTELPLNGRNFTQLATLVPGVTRGVPNGPASGANGSAETFRFGNTGGASLAVNGLRPQANNFLLDGVDNNESLVNTIVFFPPAEAIQEFRVQTSVAPAEYGRAGGAIINTSIKSGANEVHGSAFEFLRNSELDARPTFAGARNPFKRNQFGGTVGLPVIKNKFFLFGDYQGLRQNTPLSQDFVTVPTAAMRNGDFSQLLNPAASGLSQAYIIRNLQTGQPFPNNIIPASLINKVGQNYLNAYPLPNLPGKVQQNYAVERQQVQNFDDFDVRGDYVAGEKDQLFSRFSFGEDSSVTSSRFPSLPAGFGSGSNFTQPRGFVLGETHSFTPTLLNELRASWQRQFFGYNPPLGGTPVSANLGIPNANTSPILGGGALIGGNGGQLEYTGDYGSYLVPQNTYQLIDSVTKIWGSHTVKAGTNLIWRQVNLFRPKAGKGFFNLFGNGQGPGSTGYEVADVLAGFVNNYQIGEQNGFFGTRSWENGFFVQDDWRVTRKLVLNIGLRYDYLTWPTEVYNRQSNFNLATGQVLLAGKGAGDSLIATDKNNFAPRFGFAYDLFGSGKTVLRGGYGMFYFVDRGGIDNQLAQNPPFGGITQINYSDSYRVTLSGAAPPNSNNWLAATGPLPAAGVLTNFNPANPQNVSLVAALQNNRVPYVHEYNFQLQHQLFADAVVSLGFVGSLGRKLSFYYDANQQVFNSPSGTRRYPGVGSIVIQADRGDSSYNSFQAQFEKRFSKGLQFRASYTWSHTTDDSDGAFDGTQPQDIRNFHLDHGNASIDQRQLFVASSLYELPFGRGKRFGANLAKPVQTILGNWQLNGIFTVQTGLPFTVIQNGVERPDVTHSVAIYGSTQRWFDTSAFTPAPQNSDGVFLRPGSLGRNTFAGPGNTNLDISVFKDFQFTERVKLQFRSEFYNIANHPHLANPDANLQDGNFGRITGTLLSSERQIQFAARVQF